MLRGLKHLLFAMLLLAGLLCALEVGLRAWRFHQAGGGNALAVLPDDQVPLLPSWDTFQRLQPLTTFRATHPDTGETTPVRINSIGLRGPEVLLPKPPGVFRVLCLGDETTFAVETPEEGTYCGRLQVRLQRRTQLDVEVVNAGIPEGCPLVNLLYLRHRLLGVQPDLVLAHVDERDIADDRSVRPYTMVDAGGVPVAATHPLCSTRNGTPIERLAAEFVTVAWVRDRAGQLWEERSVSRPTSPGDRFSSANDRTERGLSPLHAEQALIPLAQMKALLAGIYCELIVSTCPAAPSAGDDAWPAAAQSGRFEDGGRRSADGTDAAPRLSAWLAEFAAEHGLLLADATAEFREARSPDALFLRRAGGLSEEGHDLYAAVLTDFIVRNVPGVWTGPVATPTPPQHDPLPDVARSPRGRE